MSRLAKDLAAEIDKLRRRAHEDGQTPHKVTMHPMTWRDFTEEHRDLMRFGNAAMAPPSYMGILIETDPIVPQGRAVAFDADGDLLVRDETGRYRKAISAIGHKEAEGGE